MSLTIQIAARVDRKLKRRIAQEVRGRRARGEGIQDADIIREALIQYLERRENGKVQVPA